MLHSSQFPVTWTGKGPIWTLVGLQKCGQTIESLLFVIAATSCTVRMSVPGAEAGGNTQSAADQYRVASVLRPIVYSSVVMKMVSMEQSYARL